MLSNFQFVLFVCLLTFVPYWLIEKKAYHLRSSLLIFSSLLIIAVISLQSLIVAFLILVQAFLMIRLQVYFKFAKSIFFSTFIFLPLILIGSLVSLKSSFVFFEIVGLSYYTLKLYSLIRDVNRLENKPHFNEVVLYVFFFPVFSVGPIENFKAIQPRALNVSFSLEEIVYGAVRVMFGLFKVVYLADTLLLPLIESYSLEHISSFEAWVWTVLSFVYLYLNFSGFSDLAIGVSKWFGINVRENFNHPYLSSNIQEFWQRWHISLGAWVSQYLYFPLVRNNGKPLFSLLIVFILMGAWHYINLNYLIWGVMHGLAMVLSKTFDRSLSHSNTLANIRSFKVYSIFTTIITLLYVALLSKFANLSNLDQGYLYLKVLF